VTRMPRSRHVPRHSTSGFTTTSTARTSTTPGGMAPTSAGHTAAARTTLARVRTARTAPARTTLARVRTARRTAGRRAAALAGAAAICAAILPGGVASATSATQGSGTPTLTETLAKANALSQQIDNLSQQYDGLKIQLQQAQAEATLAKEDAVRDERLLAQDQSQISAIAVEGYMTGGMNPSMQLLETSSPQNLLNRASIMTQLEQQNGAKVSLVAAAESAAVRAEAAAAQQQRRAKSLAATMATKVSQIQQKEDFFNSQAFQQAAAIFSQTGHYPDIHPQGDSVGVQALRWALTKLGDPYVWGAAGPDSFDCSGLVMWAYAQVGISLEHFTGDQWNEGEHISRSELEPGDLVFFYPDIGHVGLYVGNGLMVDAPTFGQPVQVQPVFWSAYVGAVRIVA
jgi:cell wall-associated NlpC family hydrolase